METVKINRDYAGLRQLDNLGESALKSAKLMDLIVNGATLMSVNKNTLRGIIRVLLTGAAAEVTRLEGEIPHWIPASERLPEPETSVLILQHYGEDAPYANITIGHLHQESDLRRKPYWTWIAYGADMVNPKIEAYHRAAFICPGDEFVTHWMPLPAAPKEEK